ncbi:MAG: beta-xylosidase, partial [Sciscionella sp.]
MYTDTTAANAGWNGAGQFVIRSTDPLFRTGVEVLAAQGFTPVTAPASVLGRSVVDAFSADLMWADTLNAWALAHETSGATTITFFSKDFRTQPYHSIALRGAWQEGPGLIRTPQGHAPVSVSAPCSQVPFDVVRATSSPSAPTGLSRFGVTAVGLHGCAGRAMAERTLFGFGYPSPQRTVDLVVSGGVVQVDRRSVAAALATSVLNSPPPSVSALPVLAALDPGAAAVRAPGRPLAMLLSDHKLWPVSPTLPAVNSSPVEQLTDRQYDTYQRGQDLSVLRR